MKNQILESLGNGHQYAIVEKKGKIFYYQGKIHRLKTLNELQKLRKDSNNTLVFVIPFRVIREKGKGYEAKGDEPILVLEALEESVFKRKDFLKILKKIRDDMKIELEGQINPSISDEEFAQMVKSVIKNEINEGNACQVVLSRKFRGKIKDMGPMKCLILYWHLLQLRGQYITFLFDASEEAIVGASPECHLRIQGNKVIMNPIAGTLPKKTSDPSFFRNDLMNFLEDEKEIIELCQILDEELKMIEKTCPKGGRVIGPSLRETGKVVHTQYQLVGKNGDNNPIEALKATLQAPTVVGSPLESATRIINKYELESRGYYGGVYGILYPNGDLDSAIFIRTAYLEGNGRFEVQAGAGIVKDSDPIKEARETTAKAEGFLQIFKGQTNKNQNYLKMIDFNEIGKLLKERNDRLSSFHLQKQSGLSKTKELEGVKIIIINNEDDFAYLLAHMASHMGCEVEVKDTFEFDPFKDKKGIVILGPGPGNINDQNNPRMVRLLEITHQLIQDKRLVVGICLGHQVLLKTLRFKIERQAKPTQGLQLEVEIFDKKEKVAFYNSFTAYLSPQQKIQQEIILNCKITTDENKRIIMFRSPKIISSLFHPESVMTQNGYEIFKKMLLFLIYKRK